MVTIKDFNKLIANGVHVLYVNCNGIAVWTSDTKDELPKETGDRKVIKIVAIHDDIITVLVSI